MLEKPLVNVLHVTENKYGEEQSAIGTDSSPTAAVENKSCANIKCKSQKNNGSSRTAAAAAQRLKQTLYIRETAGTMDGTETNGQTLTNSTTLSHMYTQRAEQSTPAASK